VKINNTFWAKFEEFGFYYRIKEGVLKQTNITSTGEVCTNSKVIVSKIPDGFESDYFFRKINEEFYSNLTTLK